MSGFLVLVGCLALVTLIAIPSFARANAALTAAAQTSSLTREIAEPIYLQWLKGSIVPDGTSIKSKIRFDALSCESLMVTVRKAGGETFSTPGVSDGKGGCSYSFSNKVPADGGAWTLGVQMLSLAPTPASLAALKTQLKEDPQFNALYLKYSQKQDNGVFLKSYADKFTWTKGGITDLSVKGETQSIKLNTTGASMTVPVYFSW